MFAFQFSCFLPFFSSIISVTEWTRSHNPFWNGLSASVVINLTLRIEATSRISSELNSPPLSVIIDPIVPKTAIHLCIKASMASLGFFLLIKTETVYLDHIAIICRIQCPLHCFKSIETFSLNWDATGKLTTGREGVFAYRLHSSHVLPVSSSKLLYSSFQWSASCKSDFSFFMGGWANCLWSLNSILYLYLLGISSRSTENTFWTGIFPALSMGMQ